MRAGDRNTSYFHKIAEVRKNYNHMTEIQTTDRLITNYEAIKIEASKHFYDLFTAQPTPEDAKILNLVPRAMKNKDNDNLTKKVTMEEIKKEVAGMEEDSPPGLDDFNATFIKI